jgi:segregation and condensation protein A
MQSSSFRVQASDFDGPLDLLLSLIEKRKMHVSDISVAKVADEYIEYIQKNSVPVEQIADFILTAATLMLIKSRSLLPGFAATKDEEGDMAALEARLARYGQVKTGAQKLAGLLRAGAVPRSHFKTYTPPAPQKISFTPGTKEGRVLLRELTLSVKNLISLLPTREKIPQTTVQKTIRLSEVMKSLEERLARTLSTTLHEFAGDQKQTLILAFLAILELAKQGTIHISQRERFHDIKIDTTEVTVPNYMHS